VGKIEDWELVHTEPIGKGGQSQVYLVRRPERKRVREDFFKTLRDLAGQSLPRSNAEAFAVASAEIARNDRPSELAALKKFIPRSDDAQGEESSQARLKSEIDTLKRGLPGFLKLLDWNESERWIVTEYCENGTLDRHLHTYKGDVLRSLRALVPLLKTVKALHKLGIVHRDIKPQNIFIGSDGELLLGDFGIVYLPDLPDRPTFTGESVGPRDFTPPWISIGDKPGQITRKFDVYMIGKLLWCMVSGRMKLHREDFRHPTLDLTKLFPGDPHMYMVNTILDKSVVTREEDCWGLSAFMVMVESYLGIIEHGGQLLNEGVPRLCRVCGNGTYTPELAVAGQPNATAPLHFHRVVNQMAEAVGGFKVMAYSCNHCGNVQLFKTDPI
jgi:serine/threonine protein kinase